MSKILVVGNGNNKVVTEATIDPPEGYVWYFTADGNKTLMDSRGRINISYLFSIAKQQDPVITNKKPNKWLVNKPAVEMRADYQTKLGFDPVKTIDTTTAVTFQEVGPISDRPLTWTTTGTYMVDRMCVMYGAWVSPYFREYMLNTFMLHANNAVSASGLIMSTDELRNENNAINARHNMLAIDAINVPDNLRLEELHGYDVFAYNVELRCNFNINTTVEGLFKYFKDLGIFYLDGMRMNSEQYDMYIPKPEFVNNTPSLFNTTTFDVNGVIITRVSITRYGHNCLVQGILDYFGSIQTVEME